MSSQPALRLLLAIEGTEVPLAGAARRVVGRWKLWRGEVELDLSDWIEEQVGMPFEISGGHDWGSIRELVYGMHGPAYLE